MQTRRYTFVAAVKEKVRGLRASGPITVAWDDSERAEVVPIFFRPLARAQQPTIEQLTFRGPRLISRIPPG